MRKLIDNAKNLSLHASKATCYRSFLNSTMTDPACQSLVNQMDSISLDQLGITGADDPHYFQGKLNRVTIDGESEDYRLVLFFIKKGTRMPLHDHPNMSVFFKLMFGGLSYRAYDKIDDKFRYNDFSNDEYEEFLATKSRV